MGDLERWRRMDGFNIGRRAPWVLTLGEEAGQQKLPVPCFVGTRLSKRIGTGLVSCNWCEVRSRMMELSLRVHFRSQGF